MSLFDDNSFYETSSSSPGAEESGPVASLQPAKKINVISAKKALKIPNWVWILIAIVSIAIITVAILVPLVFLKDPSKIKPSPISPTGSQSPNIPIFNNISPAAILFQLAIPAMDGLSKNAINITETDFSSPVTKVGYVLVGQTSQTGYYVTSFNPPSIAGPTILNAPGVLTTWASAEGKDIFMSNPNYFSCASDATTNSVPCQAFSWPNPDKITNTTYTVTSWKKASDTVMISFRKNDLDLYDITFQTPAVVLNLSQTFIGLTNPLDVSVVCMFATANQDYLSFGVVQKFTNTVMYITYTDINVANPVQTLILDPLSELLQYASMTNDGLWLIVLSNERLILYNRVVTEVNIDFNLVDSLYLKSSITPSTCAIDQTYNTTIQSSGNKIWCAIGSSETYTITVPVDINKKAFILSEGRLVPTVNINNTSGPMNIRYLSDSDSLFLLGSDEFGNYENTTLDLKKY
jgi:hypothetical protein